MNKITILMVLTASLLVGCGAPQPTISPVIKDSFQNIQEAAKPIENTDSGWTEKYILRKHPPYQYTPIGTSIIQLGNKLYRVGVYDMIVWHDLETGKDGYQTFPGYGYMIRIQKDGFVFRNDIERTAHLVDFSFETVQSLCCEDTKELIHTQEYWDFDVLNDLSGIVYYLTEYDENVCRTIAKLCLCNQGIQKDLDKGSLEFRLLKGEPIEDKIYTGILLRKTDDELYQHCLYDPESETEKIIHQSKQKPFTRLDKQYILFSDGFYNVEQDVLYPTPEGFQSDPYQYAVDNDGNIYYFEEKQLMFYNPITQEKTFTGFTATERPEETPTVCCVADTGDIVVGYSPHNDGFVSAYSLLSYKSLK